MREGRERFAAAYAVVSGGEWSGCDENSNKRPTLPDRCDRGSVTELRGNSLTYASRVEDSPRIHDCFLNIFFVSNVYEFRQRTRNFIEKKRFRELSFRDK